MPSTKQTGKIGEEIAAKYLINKGFDLIERNYGTKRGEIDIICEKDGILTFVEVKYRTTNELGRGTAAVDRHKRRKIINTARTYIYENNISPRKPVRFDVIDIYDKDIEHFENAFWV